MVDIVMYSHLRRDEMCLSILLFLWFYWQVQPLGKVEIGQGTGGFYEDRC